MWKYLFLTIAAKMVQSWHQDLDKQREMLNQLIEENGGLGIIQWKNMPHGMLWGKRHGKYDMEENGMEGINHVLENSQGYKPWGKCWKQNTPLVETGV